MEYGEAKVTKNTGSGSGSNGENGNYLPCSDFYLRLFMSPRKTKVTMRVLLDWIPVHLQIQQRRQEVQLRSLSNC